MALARRPAGGLIRTTRLLIAAFAVSLLTPFAGATTGFAQVPPTVASIAPSSGPTAGGTSVIITGTDFTGATDVSFGAAAATFNVDNATQITATSPAGAAGTVEVTVTTPDGTSGLSSADQFTYIAPPSVTSVTPNSGTTAGGTPVTIAGTDFTGATAVTFGATAAATFNVDNATQITATSPAGSAGPVDVTVTTPNGTSATSGADEFTFVAPPPAPAVAGISPSSGSTAGGTAVTITGTDLTGTTDVNFGGTAAAGFSVDNATQITATSPAGAAGTVDVTVTTPGGTSATGSADQFTYVAPPPPVPAVTGVAPASGPTAGGTSVTITGTDFTGATDVTFGGTSATFNVDNGTQITATSPAGSGTVDVTVTTAGGTSPTGAADQFTYVAPPPAPVVSDVAPTSGTTAGGTSVTITGTDLTGATAVNFGGTAAATFNVDDSTHITATTPAGAAGVVDITVTTPGGTSATSSADQFTFVAPPAVSSVLPGGGPTVGGTSVTITGTDFTGATGVSFGATAATTYNVDSANQITATSPSGSAGTVDVTVTTAYGTSATGSTDHFTYVAPPPAPAVTGIAPTSGPAPGGTSVVITGSGFTGATAVSFGATAASGFTVDNAGQITATNPAGSGTVDVTVTTPSGTSAVVAADEFTYVPAPAVGSLSPTSGPTAGGSSVTISGTDFTGATAVSFGATAATTFNVDNATQITATSPAGTGTVDVMVTTPSGTSAAVAADQFTYVPPPVVSSLSPGSGPEAGGTSVTITGTDFAGATAVSFGSSAATGYSIDSATQITAASPAGIGTVDVTVTTPSGTSAVVAADQFTYIPAPVVTSVSPTSGPAGGGTTVIVTGSALTGATGVRFGATAATSFTVDSATQITATSPAGSGTVHVTVTTPGGTSAPCVADEFTYTPVPAVTSVAPGAGPLAGGTTVTITGTDLTGASGVSFGPDAATSFTADSDTQVTATSPAGSAGTVDITVTTPGGTSATSAADEFIYASGPVVTSVFRNLGPNTGGTSVTITGANFATATLVSFGTAPASSFTIGSDASITAVSPKHASGAVDVTVTSAGGTSPIAASDRFTFVGASLCATFDLTKVPTAWVKHISQYVYVTAINCGLKTWPSTGTARVDLNMHFTTKAGGSPQQNYWLNSITIHITKNVAPNRSIALKFAITPTFYGQVSLEALMRQEPGTWFDRATHSPHQYASVKVTVSKPIFCAIYDLTGVPTSWVKGHAQTFSVTVTNCGNVKWPVPHYGKVEMNLHFTTVPGGVKQKAYWYDGVYHYIYVSPGASAVVSYTITPTLYGHVYMEAGIYVVGYAWFDQASRTQQIASVPVTVKKS